MRRQTTYRRIAAELPPIGILATTRRGEVGEVIAHEDGQARLQFAGSVQGLYEADEITWQVVGAQTEGKWQTEGAELHLADRDYPELRDILGKPAPEIVQPGNEWGRVASKTAGNQCNECKKWYMGPMQLMDHEVKSGHQTERLSGDDQEMGRSRTADNSNPNNTDGFSVTTWDPFGEDSLKSGDCHTCFGEGAFSDLRPDGKGFGPEHDCPDCGGSGRA
jgi:hypothetical protein